MLNAGLAPTIRALLFFGFMGAAIGGLTLGARFQALTDQSSTSVALARSLGDPATDFRVAAVDRSDRSQSTAKRAIPSPSQQAMAENPTRRILR